jgi:hypothetical protein
MYMFHIASKAACKKEKAQVKLFGNVSSSDCALASPIDPLRKHHLGEACLYLSDCDTN